eukprot:gene18741-20630_t
MEVEKRIVKKSRMYSKLPVVICEWHHHILHHIHRAIGSRHLPENGLKMLHFDSHPDLTFPLDLAAESCFDRESLYDKIEIADWILPLVYEDHLKDVCWLKPCWSDQIEDGCWSVKVGENKDNQLLRISCKEDYFLEELLYSNEKDLGKSKKLELSVMTIDHTYSTSNYSKDCATLNEQDEISQGHGKVVVNTECEKDGVSKTSLATDENLILDIDLDFFSTYNPFILRHNQAIAESLKKRNEQLVMLQKTILYFQQNFMLDEDFKTDFLNLIQNDLREISESEINLRFLDLMKEIDKHERNQGREIDLELVHFAGCSSELPHHRSTIQEIDSLIISIQKFLLQQPKPCFITISRSAEDEYTPPDQVDYIQEKVLTMLNFLYKDIDIIKDYEIEDVERLNDKHYNNDPELQTSLTC